MRFIKITILVFVLSSNLMMGQKTEIPKWKPCVENKSAESEIIEKCSESEIKTGAFFRFVAF